MPFYHWSGESGVKCLPACAPLGGAAVPLWLAVCVLSCMPRLMAGCFSPQGPHPTTRLAEDNRQALLRRVIAEARAAPIPEVHAAQVRMSNIMVLASVRMVFVAH